MLNDSQYRAIVAISELKVAACSAGNEVGSDTLRFSVWIAALASAAFGVVLLNADNLMKWSSLTAAAASDILLGSMITLTASIVTCGVVHYLVNSCRYYGQLITTLINAQLARVLSEQTSFDGTVNAKDVIAGAFLSEEDRVLLSKAEESTSRFLVLYQRALRFQMALAGVSCIALLVVGAPRLR
jgi:hypothetical protein